MIGSSLSDGRRWWYFGEQRSLTVEAASWRWQVGFKVGDRSGAGGRGFGFHLGGLYVSFEGIGWTTGRDGIPGPPEREWGFYFSDGYLCFRWAHDPWNGSRRVGRRWLDTDLYGKHLTGGWYLMWSWKDALLGRAIYTSTPVEEPVEVFVVMPEGRYKAMASVSLDQWQRPRWPWAQWRRTLSLDIPQGIPIPGKGENSWDCGDDATFGVHMALRPRESIQEALHRLALDTLRERACHASLDWRPRETWAVEAWKMAAKTET